IISVVPVMVTTYIILNGNCIGGVWINQSEKLAYGVVTILGSYILPVTIFIYCYGRIALVIQGRAKVAHNVGTTSLTNVGDKQKNVVKTMVLISVAFALCWLPL